MTRRWLSIIGIGEDGRNGLSRAALAAVDVAEVVFGGERHLQLIGATPGQQVPWRVPFEANLSQILALRGRSVVVLASGDPFWFGVGVTLARQVSPDEMAVMPAPSSFSLAAARLGWALAETDTLGLNARPVEELIPHLHDGARILALSAGSLTPAAVARLVSERGFGSSRIAVLEALGGPSERIRLATAETFACEGINPLNLTAIEVVAGPDARPLPLTSGLDDSRFESDGQLTKREIRAVSLSSLAPRPGQRLWDVGLGSGSVAIEWLLAHPRNSAIGFERDAARAARAVGNARALGVPRLDVRTGEAPGVMSGCPKPDAVFIGGGAADPGVIEACWAALSPGGRLVINAVTLETEALLIQNHCANGGSLLRLAISRAEPVGTMRGWRAAMPVTQWVGIKP